MTALVLVRPHEVDEIAPQVMPLLVEACERIGLWDASDVLGWVADGKMQLWCALAPDVRAICVTEVLTYPRRKVLSVCVLTGKDRSEWLLHIESLHEWARSVGCVKIVAWARLGWSKVLAPAGFRTTHVLLEKDLVNGNV